MSTTSTVATVKAKLVETITTAVSPVPVTYAWPGKNTMPKCVFLGPHPETADIRLDLSSSIATINAGRRQREEEYTVRVTVWTFRPDLSPDKAETCESEAFAVLADIENALADDHRIGLAATTVQRVRIESVASTLFPFQAGWACELSINVAVSAFLT